MRQHRSLKVTGVLFGAPAGMPVGVGADCLLLRGGAGPHSHHHCGG